MDWKGLIAWKAIATRHTHAQIPTQCVHDDVIACSLLLNIPLLIRTHFCQDKHGPRIIRILALLLLHLEMCIYDSLYSSQGRWVA